MPTVSTRVAPVAPGRVPGCSFPGSHYWLASYIFVAHTRNGAVILDLREDQYLGIGLSELRELASVVIDWPTTPSGASSPSLDSNTGTALLSSLLARGILTTEPPPSRIPLRTGIDLQCALVAIGDELDVERRISIGGAAAFARTALATRSMLRLLPISSIVEAVHRRKLQGQRAGAIFEPDRVTALVCEFRRLRPFAFVARDHCLFHALCLINFLAHYRVFPEWVFGVRVDPWAAHSWVQHNQFLLDTNPEKVCGFEPILAV